MKSIKGCIAILGLLMLSLWPVMAQEACTETVGTRTRHEYYSSWLQQTMYYTVYTPPCYASTTQTYPTVYLMHGSNENDESWERLGMLTALDTGISSGRYPPMILVMPFGNVIANRNRFDNVSWSNIFLTEMMPAAESLYRIDKNPQNRVIAGISRGGFWAYQIGLRHPELFGAIAGHSGFFDEYHAEPQDNPLDLMLEAPGIDNMVFWLDRGKDDFAAPGLDIMGQRMQERGVSYTYTIHPEGQHYITYWAQHVSEYLDFYAAAIQPDTSAQPTLSPVDVAAQPTALAVVSDTAVPANTTPSTWPTTVPISGFATNTPDSVSAAPVVPTVAPESASVVPAEPTVTPDPSNIIFPTATFAPPTPGPLSGEAVALYLPVVAFPSLQTTVTREQIDTWAAGQYDPLLVIVPQTREAFPNLSPQTTVIELEQLRSTLWRDRTLIALIPFDALTEQLRPLWMDNIAVVDQLANYPFASKTQTPNFDPALLTRITISGVTAITRNTRTAFDANGVEWAAGGIFDYVNRSTLFHMSNEVSISPDCPVFTNEMLGGGTSMCSKAEHFELLKRLGVDIIELTGNHNNDYGYTAYTETLAFYRANGFATVGGGSTPDEARQPLIKDINGTRVGWIACNVPGPYYALANASEGVLGGIRPGAAACDKTWVPEAIASLKTQVDVVIVSLQQEEIEDYKPSAVQQYDFRQIADWGADVVIGTAAHKPQIYEFYATERGSTAVLHYGPGNLFFDQPFWGNSRFIMDTLYLYDGRLMTTEIFPGIIEEAGRPRLMTPEEQTNFLYFMFVQQNGF